MAYSGTLAVGELVSVLEGACSDLSVMFNRMNGYRAVGIYIRGEHVFGFDYPPGGRMEPRTILDAKRNIVTRGWKDVIARLYWERKLVKTRRLKSLMGEFTLNRIIDSNSPFLERTWETPGQPTVDGVPDKAWMPKPEYAQ